jgi:membrane protein
VLVLGFGIYLNFSDPGSAYGVLGGVIVLLFFLCLTAAVLLIGAEINAVAYAGAEERSAE